MWDIINEQSASSGPTLSVKEDDPESFNKLYDVMRDQFQKMPIS
jgi:hypothetical protein